MLHKDILFNFVEWTKIKFQIHIAEKNIYFRNGEIWWASLGSNIGYEQNGKNLNFERPIVVLKKFNQHTLWIIPLSTKIKNNPYYYNYKLNNEEYSAIIIQLRLISSKRLIRKIGLFPRDDFQNIKSIIKKML